jgi:hypothetical protein
LERDTYPVQLCVIVHWVLCCEVSVLRVLEAESRLDADQRQSSAPGGTVLIWRDREKPRSKDIVRQTCKSRKDEPAGIRLLKVETPNLDNDAQTDCLSICSKADTRITRKTG